MFSLAVGREHKRHAYVAGSGLKLNPANVTDGYIRSLVCGRMSSPSCLTRGHGDWSAVEGEQTDDEIRDARG